MIPITKESDDFKTAPVENCCFCLKETRYWYVPKDVAVCPKCAVTYSIAQVPSKEDWCVQVRKVLKMDE